MVVIGSWRELHTRLKDMSEDELRIAINYEVSTYKREAILDRLFSRYNKLRGKRELELLQKGEMLL